MFHNHNTTLLFLTKIINLKYILSVTKHIVNAFSRKCKNVNIHFTQFKYLPLQAAFLLKTDSFVITPHIKST